MFDQNDKPTQAQLDMLRKAASSDFMEATAAQQFLAKSVETPLRKGIMSGDNLLVEGIFEPGDFTAGQEIKYPLHFLTPGTERNFFAYNVPSHGKLPRRNVEGDYVQVAVYHVGNSIDVNREYLRDARWDVWSDAVQLYEDGFVSKINADGWHVILTAAVDRNIVVFDSDAPVGTFTKRALSLTKVVMARNGGGNLSSRDGFKLTDFYMSTEAFEDIRNWNVDQIDEVTRREIFTSAAGTLTRLFGVNLHELRELGVGQEYQNYFSIDLGGSMGTSDEEICVGLDLSKRRGFVMPVKYEVETFTNPMLLTENKMGIYGRGSWGFASLDGRQAIITSF
jgi:hypothetical protein